MNVSWSAVAKRMVVAVGMVAFGAIAQAGSTLDRVEKTQQLVMTVSAKWPPHAFLNDQHQLVGFDIDVAKEIARRLGVKAKFDTPSFDLVTGGHWNKRWDLAVFSITPTKARAKVLDFPAVYYYSTYVFVVHKNSKAQNREDLKNVKFGVEGGTTADDYMHHNLQIDASSVPPFHYLDFTPKMGTYGNSMLPFEDLRLGDGVRIGAIIAEKQTALNAIKNGYPIRILPNDIPFQEPIAVATDKGDPEFDQKIADIISGMKKDGTLTAISKKWYDGVDYTKIEAK